MPDVMDVYVTKKMRVRIMDFNPVAGTTQPLLFRWDELPYNLSSHFDEKSGNSMSVIYLAVQQIPGLVLTCICLLSSHDPACLSLRPLPVYAVEEDQSSSIVPPRDDEVDVRFVTDTLAIQPGERISYGVPYDLVDNSEGSALGEMLRQLEQATMNNSQE